MQGDRQEVPMVRRESHPVVKHVGQGPHVHSTLISRAPGARGQHPANIAGLGGVLAMPEIERPAGIATARVGVKYAREWDTEADETALAAPWTLRSDDRSPVRVEAEDDVGCPVDR